MIFGVFWNISLILMTLTNWLLKSKCMLKHKYFFGNIGNVFLMFWWKSGILILDLYLYDIKIQTNINQIVVKHLRRKITNFKMIFWILLGWARLGPKGNWAEICTKWNRARTGPKENLLVVGLNPATWAGLMFQPETTNVLVAGYRAEHSVTNEL
jgi:hypothetical protein